MYLQFFFIFKGEKKMNEMKITRISFLPRL